MMYLHLTKTEKDLFAALPDSVRNGWKTEDEALTFEDTDHRRYMRMSVMKLHDPRLLGLKKKLMELKDKPEEARKVLEDLDIRTVNDDDMLQLFYAMGPAPITYMILSSLQPDATDEDLKNVAALSMIRHMILLAFVEAYSSPSYT